MSQKLQNLFSLVPKHKLLLGSFIFLSLYTGALYTLATTYVSPGTILDPLGIPGSYTVTPPLTYGGAVTSGHDGEVLYMDGSGELVSDESFTRDSVTGDTLIVASPTGDYGTFSAWADQTLSMGYYDDVGNVSAQFQASNNGNTISWDADTTDDITTALYQSEDVGGYGIAKGTAITWYDAATDILSASGVGDASAGGLPNNITYSATSDNTAGNSVFTFTAAQGGNAIWKALATSATIDASVKVSIESGNEILWDADVTDDINTIIEQGENIFGVGVKGTAIFYGDATTPTNGSANLIVGYAGGDPNAVQATVLDVGGDSVGFDMNISDGFYGSYVSPTLRSELKLQSTGSTMTWKANLIDSIITKVEQSQDILGLGALSGSALTWQDTDTQTHGIVGAIDGSNAGLFPGSTLMSTSNIATGASSSITTNYNNVLNIATAIANIGNGDTDTGFEFDDANALVRLRDETAGQESKLVLNSGTAYLSYKLDTASDEYQATLGDGTFIFSDRDASKNFLSLDAINGVYQLGDIDGAVNGTFLLVDDDNMNVNVMANNSFQVGDTLGNGMIVADLVNHLVYLGDPGLNFNSTLLTLDDENRIISQSANDGANALATSVIEGVNGISLTWNPDTTASGTTGLQSGNTIFDLGGVQGTGMAYKDSVSGLQVLSLVGDLTVLGGGQGAGLFGRRNVITGNASVFNAEETYASMSFQDVTASARYQAIVDGTGFRAGDIIGDGNGTRLNVSDTFNAVYVNADRGFFVNNAVGDQSGLSIDILNDLYRVGDIDGTGSGTLLTIDDNNGVMGITAETDNYFEISSTAGHSMFLVSVANNWVNIGDFSGGNGTKITVDDDQKQIMLFGNSESNYISAFWNQGNDANRYGIQITAGANDASGTTYYINARDGNGDQVGYIANTSGTFALTDVSDVRTKTNITDTNINGLSVVNGLHVVDFNRIAFADGPLITGFIAQEVEQVYPQMVTEGENGYLGITKETLVPVLVKAIQELDFKIKPLEDLMTSENTFASVLRNWLANTANGVTSIFSKEVVTEQICVKDENGQTCLTRSQLDALISGGGSGSTSGGTGSTSGTTGDSSSGDTTDSTGGTPATGGDTSGGDSNSGTTSGDSTGSTTGGDSDTGGTTTVGGGDTGIPL